MPLVRTTSLLLVLLGATALSVYGATRRTEAERARAGWTLPEELLRSPVRAGGSGEGDGVGPDPDGEAVLDESGEAAGPLS